MDLRHYDLSSSWWARRLCERPLLAPVARVAQEVQALPLSALAFSAIEISTTARALGRCFNGREGEKLSAQSFENDR